MRTEMTAERLIARRAGPGKMRRRGRQDGLRRAHVQAVHALRGVGPGCGQEAQLDAVGAGSSGVHGSGAAGLGEERISDQPPRSLRLRVYEHLNCEAASPSPAAGASVEQLWCG